MNSDQYALIPAVEARATELLTQLPDTMLYHNLAHTKGVVKGVAKIAEHSHLDAEETENAVIAAWFHDTGFTEIYVDHEEASVRHAEAFLKEQEMEPERIDVISQCIRATKLEVEPTTKTENVLCDADFIHLSKGSYFEKLMLLRREWELCIDKKYDDKEWHEYNIDFLIHHQFYTEYGKTVLETKKLEVKRDEQKILKKLNKMEDELISSELQIDPAKLKELKKKLKKAEGRSDRGIETMFRVTSRNHISLSSIADNKANILISVNSIIISIIIGSLINKLDSNPHLQVPTYILLAVNVVTIVFAILATRPNVTTGRFTKKDIEDKKANLLFFGNFHQMKREDYRWGMLELMNKSDFLYGNLIDDIYFLGRVLGTKYRRLRIAYTFFMFGIVVAVIAFVLSNMYYMQAMDI